MLDNIINTKRFKYIYTFAVFILACLSNIFEVEIYGAAFFALVVSVMLVVSSKITDVMLPTLLVTVFVTKLYELLRGAEVYKIQVLQCIWVLVPLFAAIVFHFIYYKKHAVTIGRSFVGLCAISLSLIFGGFGTISAEEYFSPTALFYVCSLSVGMILVYIFVKSQFTDSMGSELAKIMYIVGLFAAFCVIMFYVRDWDKFIETGKKIYFQSKNELSTFLMFAMPFPMYYAAKNPLHICSTVIMYVCILFTGSRGGFLMGTVQLFIIFVTYTLSYSKSKRQKVVYGICIGCFAIAFLCCIPLILRLYGVTEPTSESSFSIRELVHMLNNYMFRYGEARYRLLERMWGDFASNPVFGVGIGYTGNCDIYNPPTGAMNWYHMWFAQVIAGLGIVGIIAYGLQLVDRVIIFVKNRNRLNTTMFLSYLGLFLMSQVNPGEFCPIPYAMLAVTFFVVIESESAETSCILKNKT